jgi:NAD(P)-dependent dehydrogenase (short-subunit alcohol dehydrogenase family)
MSNSQPQDADVLLRFRLDGRVAFLSGATGHLGVAMARALAAAGAHVVINARRPEALENLAEQLRASGYSVSTACFDVTDGAAVESHMTRIGRQYGRLDVIVNNAVSGRPGTIQTATSADFDQAWRVNVNAAFQILQTALPWLKQAADKSVGGASVINIASMYGSVSPDPSIYGTSGANNPPYYGAAKAGLIQLMRYAACHLAADRIRVNCISPGPFPARQYLEQDPGFHERLKSKSPARRTGDPWELQGPLLFLASDASSYVTGVNLAVDGGWTAW